MAVHPVDPAPNHLGADPELELALERHDLGTRPALGLPVMGEADPGPLPELLLITGLTEAGP